MILLSVGASPGALRVPEIVRGLRADGQRTEVVLEEHAAAFVGAAAFEGGVGRSGSTPEAIVYVPAPAGTLARLARGLGGEHESGASSPNELPVFVVPELDAHTATHPAVENNLRLLQEDGYRVVWGEASSMASTGEVVAVVLGALGDELEGVKVVVTAGGTRESLDGVRFIGNRSSGKMGLALARRASRMGAEVTVIAANVGEREPGVGWVDVESVDELEEAVLGAVAGADVLLMAAAVSDFKPAERPEGKMRRSGKLSLEFEPTTDVLKGVTGRYPELFVVGFAATHGDPVADAREKRGKKGVDLVVGNDISGAGIGFGSEWNEVYLVGKDAERFVPRAPKDEVARVILEAVVAGVLGKKGGVGP